MQLPEYILLESAVFVPEESLLNFMSYFGDVYDCFIWPSSATNGDACTATRFIIHVRFLHERAHLQLLAWAYPILIDGTPVILCESMPEPDAALQPTGLAATITPSEDQDDHVCLKVFHIPVYWDAFSLYSRLHGIYPSKIFRALVAKPADSWGLKHAMVEVASPVAAVLQQFGEPMDEGIVLGFEACDYQSIYSYNEEACDLYTMFPPPHCKLSSGVRPE